MRNVPSGRKTEDQDTYTEIFLLSLATWHVGAVTVEMLSNRDGVDSYSTPTYIYGEVPVVDEAYGHLEQAVNSTVRLALFQELRALLEIAQADVREGACPACAVERVVYRRLEELEATTPPHRPPTPRITQPS